MDLLDYLREFAGDAKETAWDGIDAMEPMLQYYEPTYSTENLRGESNRLHNMVSGQGLGAMGDWAQELGRRESQIMADPLVMGAVTGLPMVPAVAGGAGALAARLMPSLKGAAPAIGSGVKSLAGIAGVPAALYMNQRFNEPSLPKQPPQVDMQQLTEAAGFVGPSQNSPMSEKADFRVGDGEWQNGLDSRVGEGFRKAAPGTAQRASERYQSTLEPHRQDQIRQLYGQAVQKYLTANAKLAEQVTNPEEKRKLLKLINKNAHETGLMMVPASERHNFPYVGEADEQAPAPGTEEVSQDGEGYGTLGGMALLVGGGAATGAAIALARKMGVPIPTAKAIIQSMMGKGGKLPPLEKAIAGGKNVPWKQLDIKGFANKGTNVRMPTGGPTGLNALNAPQKEIVSRMNALQKLSGKISERPAGAKEEIMAMAKKGAAPKAAAKDAIRHKYVPDAPKKKYK